MPIYTYECPTDGVVDVLFRVYNPPPFEVCPICQDLMPKVITLPGRVEVKQDWNEKANEYQRDPYTQAKAQLHNLDREEQLRYDKPPIKVTEEMLQVGAKAIHEGKTAPPMGPVKQAQRLQRKLAREKKQRKEE